MMSKRKLQKIMTMPINLIFRYLTEKTRIVVWLYDHKDLRMEGVILGFDEYMNVVLDDAEEVNTKKDTRRPVGRILLKGDNITLMHAVSNSAAA
ncbi:Small nuclear ribonucleoprotein E, putative [Perkinsus marinus ATCC 50983]|uniref:Small nuclear ribonucleoprotein E n=1 Tax=Perkinsus marinus (strain ATCC 50983 / TXsc) TaxID=423536 RepID=C5K896_PERM5|nr:Small nuclear ribonucleoprotein E, putative [Perkinsus marinus ATCC 50983]EER19284.1 Small nuclear ribonucleoprotein E, putative [Perkinsus marinus ATCC 50983]|eukprot:XP_002787488.1 Small nuclear ribonucleoprotein E, putative [Perkinsus marinus ATCC 50983]